MLNIIKKLIKLNFLQYLNHKCCENAQLDFFNNKKL